MYRWCRTGGTNQAHQRGRRRHGGQSPQTLELQSHWKPHEINQRCTLIEVFEHKTILEHVSGGTNDGPSGSVHHWKVLVQDRKVWVWPLNKTAASNAPPQCSCALWKITTLGFYSLWQLILFDFQGPFQFTRAISNHEFYNLDQRFSFFLLRAEIISRWRSWRKGSPNPATGDCDMWLSRQLLVVALLSGLQIMLYIFQEPLKCRWGQLWRSFER